MNVTAPAGVDGLLLRAPLGHARLLRASGRRHARDHVRAHRVQEGRLPDRAQGHHAPLRASRPGPQYYWVYESFAGDPEKGESPTTGRFLTHSQSDYRFPRTLDTRNESGRFEIVSKVEDVYTRARAPHASVRRGGLARRLSAVQVRGGGRAPAHRRPLARAALGPHRLQAARLLPLRVHGAAGGAGRHVGAVLPQEPRLPGDARLSLRRLLQRGRRRAAGHGDRASGRAAARAQAGVAQAVPRRPAAGALRRGRHHGRLRQSREHLRVRAGPVPRRSTWRSGAATRASERFGWSPTRLDEVRGLGERLADARDELRPPSDEDGAPDALRPLLGRRPLPDGACRGAPASSTPSCSSRPRPPRSWGFDSFWVAEHHFHEYGGVPRPPVLHGRRRPAHPPHPARLRRGGAALRPSAARGRGLRDGRRALGRPAQPGRGLGLSRATSTRASAWIRRRQARALRRGARDSAARVDGRAVLLRGRVLTRSTRSGSTSRPVQQPRPPVWVATLRTDGGRARRRARAARHVHPLRVARRRSSR